MEVPAGGEKKAKVFSSPSSSSSSSPSSRRTANSESVTNVPRWVHWAVPLFSGPAGVAVVGGEFRLIASVIFSSGLFPSHERVAKSLRLFSDQVWFPLMDRSHRLWCHGS